MKIALQDRNIWWVCDYILFAIIGYYRCTVLKHRGPKIKIKRKMKHQWGFSPNTQIYCSLYHSCSWVINVPRLVMTTQQEIPEDLLISKYQFLWVTRKCEQSTIFMIHYPVITNSSPRQETDSQCRDFNVTRTRDMWKLIISKCMIGHDLISGTALPIGLMCQRNTRRSQFRHYTYR